MGDDPIAASSGSCATAKAAAPDKRGGTMTDLSVPKPASPLRRKDRHLDDEAWIDRFLAGAPIGHLAFAPEGRPTIHSHNFWAAGDAIYSHGSQRGALALATSGGPIPACFTVTEHGRILVADAAADFGTEFASVITTGCLLVEDDDEASALMA
jgi:nitroimidazol reductase NimA-like FMN-containing flavoprotein (pyridoxamine 5'-phosphate oxidase superfamily)